MNVEPDNSSATGSADTLLAEVRERLLKASTATLTTLLFQRGLRNQFMQGVHRLTSRRIQLVGTAYTLRYIPAREDIDVVSVFRDPAHPQRAAVEQVPAGSVLVMDCRRDAEAASAGSILLKRLEVRGCAGVVTDGGLRDSDPNSDLSMPVYCGARSAPTNLARHHAVDIEVPIGCGGVPVYPGDIIVGDGDGVVALPREMAAEIAQEAAEKERLEEFLYEQISTGAALRGTYPPNEATLARYQEWLSKQK